MSFILIDAIVQLGDTQVIAEKTFTKEDPVFLDHFPGKGIVPGSLLVEGMAQTCGWWISWKEKFARKSVLLLADRIQFRHFVKPGELIRFESRLLGFGEGRAQFKATASVADRFVTKAELSFAIFPLNDPDGPFDPSLQAWMMEKFRDLAGPSAVEHT